MAIKVPGPEYWKRPPSGGTLLGGNATAVNPIRYEFENNHIQGLIDAAQDGDTEAARTLAENVALYLSPDCQDIPAPIRAYLMTGFRFIAAGADPAAALLLKPKKGRPRKDGYLIACLVRWFDGGRHKEDGGAYYEVGLIFNKSPESVKSIYEKWKGTLEGNDPKHG